MTAMRDRLWIVLSVVATAAAGYAVCRVVGFDPHVKEMTLAAVACAAVGGLATVPVMLARGATQGTVAQAGLIGTIVHLFGHAVVAAVVILGRVPLHASFVYWLLAMYWATLVVLAICFARSVRTAPAEASKSATSATANK